MMRYDQLDGLVWPKEATAKMGGCVVYDPNTPSFNVLHQEPNLTGYFKISTHFKFKQQGHASTSWWTFRLRGLRSEKKALELAIAEAKKERPQTHQEYYKGLAQEISPNRFVKDAPKIVPNAAGAMATQPMTWNGGGP